MMLSQNVVHFVRSPLNFFKDNFGNFIRGECPSSSGCVVSGVGDRDSAGVLVCDPEPDGVGL